MDKDIRNILRNTVTKCRQLLEEAIGELLEGQFGIHASGKVEDASGMTHLSAEDQQYREQTLVHLEHIKASGLKPKDAVAQLTRETAFTHLNRLCAFKMMEKRDLIREAVSRGIKSQGFLFYLADHPEDESLFNSGDQHGAYRHFLEWLGATLSEEIGVLFSPHDPANRLFPPQKELNEVLDLINSEDLKDIWVEDETIGWVYQYFTPEDLRKKARKESSVPRNSYELAFRNQFYTPRYVVKYLVENTLGRMWYEMRQGETEIVSKCDYLVRRPTEIFLEPGQIPPKQEEQEKELSQEEELKQSIYVEHLPKKDPRELKIIDPACGSAHFLLYCFDLLETIYQEAYEDSELGPALKKEYGSLEELQEAVPQLILVNNLHGIDIDPRATQIAALALWLRAQRTYQDLGLKSAGRPRITKTNIVCAEPMPGEDDMLEEFVAGLHPRVLGQLVEVVFEKMRLAGEAGSLLKIEEELRNSIAEAKEQWLAAPKEEQLTLFDVGEREEQEEFQFDLYGVSDVAFWDDVEDRVLAALRQYAEKASNGQKFKRQLFADDAAKGFAFIDLWQRHYDILLMNPPFGDPCLPSRQYLTQEYPICKDDIDAAFIERGVSGLLDFGWLGAIVNRTQFFKGTLRSWRKQFFIDVCSIDGACDLGLGVLDAAMVEAAAYVLRTPSRQDHLAAFFRLLKEPDKKAVLETQLETVRGNVSHTDVFQIQPSTFLHFPEIRISYWASPSFRSAFLRFQSLEGHYGYARAGLQTGDNFRFVRLAWEVPERNTVKSLSDTQVSERDSCKGWVFYAKGGEYAPYFGDIHLVVNWTDSGSEILNFIGPNGKPASFPRNQRFYFRAGLTYTERTASGFSPRVLPQGCIFDVKGPIISPVDSSKALSLLGLAMSRVFAAFLEFSIASGDTAVSVGAARQYTQGIVGCVPVPDIPEHECAMLASQVTAIWLHKCSNDSELESSRYFVLPSVLVSRNASALVTPGLRQHVAETISRQEERDLGILQATWKIEQCVQSCYELDRSAIDAIDREFGIHPEMLPKTQLAEQEQLEIREGYLKSIETVIHEKVESDGGSRIVTKKAFFANRRLELLCNNLKKHPEVIVAYRNSAQIIPSDGFSEMVSSLLSYTLGTVVGRWDIRYTTGEKERPEFPDPFDSLPVCPPGMLQGEDGLPLKETPPDYPIEIDWDGVLVDDPDHSDDIIRRIRDVLRVIWKDNAPSIEQEACVILGVKKLREYFRKPAKGGFWDDHVKRYSKSRRKAPIYWLLQSSKRNYALWIYYHRLDSDILFKALVNYVEPKLRLEKGNVDALQTERSAAGTSGKEAKRLEKDLEKAEAFVSELQDFHDKLRRVADLHLKPDLDDGVILNIAPLWELVPWKEPKKYWEDLLKGKYEWSSIGKQLREKGMVK